MSLDASKRKDAGKKLADRIFVTSKVRSHSNSDDLTAAIASIDDTMDALPGALNPAQSVRANIVQNLPEPFKSASTNKEKAIALVEWAEATVGII